MPPKSKKQARFLGMVAAGKAKVPGLSKAQARESLRGSKVKRLPERARKK